MMHVKLFIAIVLTVVSLRRGEGFKGVIVLITALITRGWEERGQRMRE